MVKRAKKKGDRKPEYSIKNKWWAMILLGLILFLVLLERFF